jgi:hypothetical protein
MMLVVEGGCACVVGAVSMYMCMRLYLREHGRAYVCICLVCVYVHTRVCFACAFVFACALASVFTGGLVCGMCICFATDYMQVCVHVLISGTAILHGMMDASQCLIPFQAVMYASRMRQKNDISFHMARFPKSEWD